MPQGLPVLGVGMLSRMCICCSASLPLASTLPPWPAFIVEKKHPWHENNKTYKQEFHMEYCSMNLIFFYISKVYFTIYAVLSKPRFPTTAHKWHTTVSSFKCKTNDFTSCSKLSSCLPPYQIIQKFFSWPLNPTWFVPWS